MQEKRSKVPLILSIIVVIAMFVTLTNLRNQITSLQNQINNMSWQHDSAVRNIQWELQSQMQQLNTQLVQMNRASFDESANIMRLHQQDRTADVHVGFNLRAFETGATVSVTARGTEGTITSAHAVQDGGRFTAVLNLPIDDNYILSFYAKGENIHSDHLMDFNLVNDLTQRMWFSVNQGMSTFHPTFRGEPARSTVTLSPDFQNITNGNTQLNISSMDMFVMIGEAVFRHWDLIPYVIDTGHGQMLERGWWHLDVFESAQMEMDVNDLQTRMSELDESEVVVKVVMTDNLGVRYEQMETLWLGFNIAEPVWSSGRRVFSGPSVAPGISASFHVDLRQNQPRVITQGEASWHHIHMVR